jgi:hypothetical protein
VVQLLVLGLWRLDLVVFLVGLRRAGSVRLECSPADVASTFAFNQRLSSSKLCDGGLLRLGGCSSLLLSAFDGDLVGLRGVQAGAVASKL